MTGLDLGILVVTLISTLVGVVRGFIRETLSLVSWIAALWVALAYAEPASHWLITYLESPALRIAVAFAGLFVVTLLLLTAVSYLIHRALVVKGIQGTDRVLGGMFGVLRALVIVTGFLLVAGLTALPQERWWRESLLVPHFDPLVRLMRDLLPTELAKELQPRG